jgi:hypothetical protein
MLTINHSAFFLWSCLRQKIKAKGTYSNTVKFAVSGHYGDQKLVAILGRLLLLKWCCRRHPGDQKCVAESGSRSLGTGLGNC